MKLTSGAITIPIERDGSMAGSITFNPEDVGFAQKFYALSEGLGAKEQEYDAVLRDESAPMGGKLQTLWEICGWLKEQVDLVFGAGCSETVFGEGCSPDMFRQFFAGVEPIIRKSRSGKTKKYADEGGDVME